MKIIIVENNPPPSFQEINPAKHPRAGPSIEVPPFEKFCGIHKVLLNY